MKIDESPTEYPKKGQALRNVMKFFLLFNGLWLTVSFGLCNWLLTYINSQIFLIRVQLRIVSFLTNARYF